MRSLKQCPNLLFVPLALVALSACGSDAKGTVATPYTPGAVVVVGEEDGGELTTIGACEERDCEAVEQACDRDDAADVIVGEDGEVIEVLCYKQDVNVQDVNVDEVETARAGNNTVLVLDGEDDGLDVEGDLTIDGNNAVVYGDGPNVSVIGGTLDVQKNNAIIRGVRIKEDVTITKNDTKLAFCVIEGDLTITGNNTTLAVCDVYGKVTITGLNTVLVDNRFQGTDTISGFNLECNANRRFDDENEDFRVDEDEVGGEVECVDAEGSPDPQKDAEDVTSDADAGAAADPETTDAGK